MITRELIEINRQTGHDRASYKISQKLTEKNKKKVNHLVKPNSLKTGSTPNIVDRPLIRRGMVDFLMKILGTIP